MTRTYVYGDSNSTQWDPGKPWPTRLGSRMVGDVAGTARVVSRAIGGQQMHLCSGRTSQSPPIENYAISDLVAAEAAGTLPDRVILCAGTNDLDVSTTPAAQFEDLLESYGLLDATIRNRWGINLYAITVFPMRVGGILSQANWEQREPRRQQINTRLKTVFGPTGRFFDADAIVGEGVPGGVQIWSPFVYDALHLNWQAHVRISDSLPLGVL